MQPGAGAMQFGPGAMQTPMQPGAGAMQFGAGAMQMPMQPRAGAMQPPMQMASAADEGMQWQQHQVWQQQQQQAQMLGGGLMPAQQQVQLDPLTGQWVSMGPLMGLVAPPLPMGAMAPPPAGMALPPSAIGQLGMSGAGFMPAPWDVMAGVGLDGLPLPGGYVGGPASVGGALLSGMRSGGGGLGARGAAGAAAAAVEEKAQAPGAPEKLTVSRVFSWQVRGQRSLAMREAVP